MKKCLVYGNCQAAAVKTYLQKNSTVASAYRFVDVKPVHLLSKIDIPFLNQVISEIDLMIYQPVSDNYKGIYQLSTRYLKDKLKSDCQVISFPVVYFTGYNPEVIYLKDLNGTVISEPFAYHDVNILRLFAQGKSVRDIVTIIQSDEFYNSSFVKKQLNNTISNLNVRENEIDQRLSPFIQDNFRNERLFHVFNHPSKTILSFIANLILERLGIKDRSFNISSNADILSKNSLPIYPSIIKYLKIQFPCTSDYRFENINYTAEPLAETLMF